MVQANLAQAEATVRSARAFLPDAAGEVWQAILAEHTVTPQQAALVQLAATHAAAGAMKAVDLLYASAGSSVLYTDNPLERALRDVHATGQHLALQRAHYQTAGRVLLGLPPVRPFGLGGRGG